MLALGEGTAGQAVVDSTVWAFRRLKKPRSRDMSARSYAVPSVYPQLSFLFFMLAISDNIACHGKRPMRCDLPSQIGVSVSPSDNQDKSILGPSNFTTVIEFSPGPYNCRFLSANPSYLRGSPAVVDLYFTTK